MQPKVVLLVEDDLPIREIVADFLVELGLTVIQTADAAQALEMLRESSLRIDLLFTDVRMPGSMDGMQLAELASVTWPTLRVLIASGHIRPSAKEIPPHSRFLPKPYTCDMLEDAIALLFANQHPVSANMLQGDGATL